MRSLAKNDGATPRKFSIDHRPNSNRRRHRHTARLTGNFGASLPASGPRRRAAAPFEDDRSLPTLKGNFSRQDVALKSVDLQGQPVKVWKGLIHLRKERRRGEPWQEPSTGLRTAAKELRPAVTGSPEGTGPRPEGTGLKRGPSAAEQLP
jgi:hypothetical protein